MGWSRVREGLISHIVQAGLVLRDKMANYPVALIMHLPTTSVETIK